MVLQVSVCAGCLSEPSRPSVALVVVGQSMSELRLRCRPVSSRLSGPGGVGLRRGGCDQRAEPVREPMAERQHSAGKNRGLVRRSITN